MNFTSLQQLKGESYLYSDLLQTDEWKETRERIIRRDGHQCTNCRRRPTTRLPNGKFAYWVPTTKWIINDEVESFILDLEQTLGKDIGIKIDPSSWRIVVDENLEYGACVPSDDPIHLQVHHKFYIKGLLPWKYEDHQLITFCQWCHIDFHKRNKVPYFNRREEVIAYLTPCLSCGGSGYKPKYEYWYEGICFYCSGTGGYKRLVADMII